MNIEMLVKLIKLANHNNAEGEANTAARRVCKMIEEDLFKCLVGYVDTTRRRPVPPPQPTPPPKPNPTARQNYGPVYDEYDKGPFSGVDFEELLKRARKAQEEADPFRTRPFSYGSYTGRNPFTGERVREEKPKKFIKCTKCQREILTGFVGPPQVFVCTECQWEQERETTFVQYDPSRWEYMCSKCRHVISFAEFENLKRPLKCPKCDRKVI